jgi:outer membrane autotransporter protein
VAPNDATIYSAEAFAFSQNHLDSITGLLSRSLSDGGGNTFYNGATAQGPGVRTWAQVDGSTLEINGAGANANTTADTAGLQGGVDVQFSGQGRVGVAVGYDYQWLHDNAGGKALENGVQVSLYGSQPLGPVGLSGVLSYAHGSDTVDRATGIGQAQARRDLNDYAGAVQLSAPFQAVGLVVTPAAGVAAQRLTSSAFTESFARSEAFAVSGAAKDLTSVSPFATVGFSHTLVTSDGVSVTPDVMLGYRYNSAARGQDVTLVAADGTVFGGERTALSRSSGLVGASLTATKGGWTAFAKFRADLADGWNDESVAVGMRVAF